MWRIRFSLEMGKDGCRRCLGLPFSRQFEAPSLPHDGAVVDTRRTVTGNGAAGPGSGSRQDDQKERTRRIAAAKKHSLPTRVRQRPIPACAARNESSR